MTVRVIPVSFPPETSREISARRFRFKLFSQDQITLMDMVYSEALGMSHAEMSSADALLRSTNGYSVEALKIIRKIQWELDTPPSTIDLLGQDAADLLAAAKACLVFGSDEAVADAEIARIVSNTPPS